MLGLRISPEALQSAVVPRQRETAMPLVRWLTHTLTSLLDGSLRSRVDAERGAVKTLNEGVTGERKVINYVFLVN